MEPPQRITRAVVDRLMGKILEYEVKTGQQLKIVEKANGHDRIPEAFRGHLGDRVQGMGQIRPPFYVWRSTCDYARPWGLFGRSPPLMIGTPNVQPQANLKPNHLKPNHGTLGPLHEVSRGRHMVLC
jgi:hypothetical protein